jgi:hypothetical protein
VYFANLIVLALNQSNSIFIQETIAVGINPNLNPHFSGSKVQYTENQQA